MPATSARADPTENAAATRPQVKKSIPLITDQKGNTPHTSQPTQVQDPSTEDVRTIAFCTMQHVGLCGPLRSACERGSPDPCTPQKDQNEIRLSTIEAHPCRIEGPSAHVQKNGLVPFILEEKRRDIDAVLHVTSQPSSSSATHGYGSRAFCAGG